MKHGDLLRSVFSSINLGEPTVHGGWKFFPMFPVEAPKHRLRTVGAAVAQGLTLIEELPAGPSVRALQLSNRGDLPVLVREGDLLTSGLQDRIVDRPALVSAGASVELPVSCVEQGRWSQRDRKDFAVSPFAADVTLRHRRMTLSRMKSSAPQSETWKHVATRRRALGHADESGSMAEAQQREVERVEALAKRFPAVYGAAGLVLCHATPQGARMALMEWFADPAACAEAWQGLVRSALSSVRVQGENPRISRTELRSLWAAFSEAPGWDTGDEGLGAMAGFSLGKTQGRALISGGRVMHMAAVRA